MCVPSANCRRHSQCRALPWDALCGTADSVQLKENKVAGMQSAIIALYAGPRCRVISSTCVNLVCFPFSQRRLVDEPLAVMMAISWSAFAELGLNFLCVHPLDPHDARVGWSSCAEKIFSEHHIRGAHRLRVWHAPSAALNRTTSSI